MCIETSEVHNAPPGQYRARDLLRVPGLLSLSRIPLALCFAIFIERPRVAFAVLIAAAMTDVLDGWWARRYAEVTATGSALDPITDKMFVLAVAITLVATDHLSASTILLLSTREIGELPLVLWFALSPRARSLRAGHASANIPGKIATLFQFTTVCSALFHLQGTNMCILAASLSGAFAALSYWRRELRIVSISEVRPGKMLQRSGR